MNALVDEHDYIELQYGAVNDRTPRSADEVAKEVLIQEMLS